MRLPNDVFATLSAERAKFGARPTDVELGLILNQTAWVHRSAGFGLSRKNGGAVVPFPGGGTIAHDVLMLADGTAWDVLVAAGEASTPTQGDSFVITDPARPWVAPVDPGPPEPPGPEPPPPAEPVCRFESSHAEWVAVHRELKDLVALTATLVPVLQSIEVRLEALELELAPPDYRGKVLGFPITLRPVVS